MIDQHRLDIHLTNGKREYIMCAANHYDDGEDHLFQPFNIDKGFVICGWRHSNVGHFYIVLSVDKAWNNRTEGFLTNKNRFLNREEALELVKENGQLTKPLLGGVLTSEDLW